MPINPKSSWPFTPFLVQNVLHIEAAAKRGMPKKPLILKTMQRFFRAGARVMEHYGVPAEVAIDVARKEIEREGGDQAKARLAALDAYKVSTVLDNQEKSTGLVAGWIEAAKVAAEDKENDDDAGEPKQDE